MALDPPFSNYEHEIYAAGMLGGRKPARPLDWRELERDAYTMLSRGPRGYIQGGAGLGETIRQAHAHGPALTPDPRPATIGFDVKS